jgi:hypothetical protein
MSMMMMMRLRLTDRQDPPDEHEKDLQLYARRHLPLFAHEDCVPEEAIWYEDEDVL